MRKSLPAFPVRMALFLRPLDPDLYPAGVFSIPPEPGFYYVGSENGSEIELSHISVSSRHAVIEVCEGLNVDLVDSGSVNGTFVNGIRVEERSLIGPGDILRFAEVEFEVSDNSDAMNGNSLASGSLRQQAIPAVDRNAAVALGECAGEERDRLYGEVENLKNEERRLSDCLADAERTIDSLRAGNEACSARASEQEELLHRLSRELEDSIGREERLRQQLSESRNTLMDREGAIAALNYELTRRESSLRQLGDQRDELQEACDQFTTANADLETETARLKRELTEAVSAKDLAEATTAGYAARISGLGARLLEDWRGWLREENFQEGASDPEMVFARIEELAVLIRSELDLIEPIWREFGEGVQDELRRRCEWLREEEAGLQAESESRRLELATVMENLKQLREHIDAELRRVQGLSRRGTEIEIPERFEAMVIIRDREQEMYRALVERLEVIDRLLSGYRGSRKLKQVVSELEAFRSSLVAILESGGVRPFEIPVGMMLSPKNRKEVQILSRKGWGTRHYQEDPFQPGEVIKVIRRGYYIGEGDDATVLRKAEVLIRGIDE
jgi:molecular chaperone GrpE (heat shock protein)